MSEECIALTAAYAESARIKARVYTSSYRFTFRFAVHIF